MQRLLLLFRFFILFRARKKKISLFVSNCYILVVYFIIDGIKIFLQGAEKILLSKNYFEKAITASRPH